MQYKKITALLFFMLVVIYADIAYANELLKIDSIFSFSVKGENDGVVVNDIMQDKKFILNFISKGKPFKVKIITVGINNESYDKQVEINSCGKVGNTEYYTCTANMFFQNQEEELDYRSFKIQIIGENGGVIDAIMGRMPDLKVSLKASKADGIYDALVLRNIHKEKVKITNITSSKYICLGDGKNEAITLNGTDSYEVKLKPNVEFCPDDNKTFDDIINIKYEFDDADVEGKNVSGMIKIKLNCVHILPEDESNGWGFKAGLAVGATAVAAVVGTFKVCMTPVLVNQF